MFKKIRTTLIFITLILFCGNALAQAPTSKENVNSVILKLSDQLFIMGESDEINNAGAEQILQEDAEQIKRILADKNYDINQEPEKGVKPLQIAAQYGYYPVVEILLKDPRYKALLNAKNELGFTILDLAKTRIRLVGMAIQPSIKYNSISFIPYIMTFPFYNGQLKPYDKTIAILQKYNAQFSCGLNQCYKIMLEKQLESLKLYDNSKMVEEDSKKNEEKIPNSQRKIYDVQHRIGESNKRINDIKAVIIERIKMLDDNSDLSDDELLKKITTTVENDISQADIDNFK